jgi:hypothetical protein
VFQRQAAIVRSFSIEVSCSVRANRWRNGRCCASTTCRARSGFSLVDGDAVEVEITVVADLAGSCAWAASAIYAG